MPDNSMQIIEKVFTFGLGWLWLLALAVWGGTANYLTRIRKNKLGFSFIELVGEWVISGFAGVVTALVCVQLGWSIYLVFAAAGIAGHMGGRAIGIMENYLQNKFTGK